MGYKIGENNIKLEIGGINFTIVYGPKLIENIKKFSEKNVEHSTVLKTEDNIKALEESQKLLVEAIDTILGKGSVDKIFNESEINYFDLMGILSYIYKEIEDFKSKQNNKYSLDRLKR